MNRRQFINSIISAFLFFFQVRLGIAKKTNNPTSDFLRSPDLIKNNTVILMDPIFLQHHISPGHPETPKRMEHIKKAIIECDLYRITRQISPETEVLKWIGKVHSNEHILAIKKNFPIAHKVATAGVSACLMAVDKVASKENTNVFCATRPPGHHALNTGREEGFCYYNNIAIAAKYAQKKYKLEKILIVDWDYHHGNSTEAIFYDDPSVLFFSTHDQFAYPGTGDPSKKGKGDGAGYNINIHLPCGATDKMIIDEFNNILVPAVKKFQPDLVLISAGFDSRTNDLLGCFDITDNGFIALTKIVMNIANEYCDDRLVSILEGGYNLEGNAKAVATHVSALETNIFSDSAVSSSGCQ